LSSKEIKALFAQAFAVFGSVIAPLAARFEANPTIREELIQDIGLAIWGLIKSFCSMNCS
jgi:hypothetical protein